MQSCGTFSGEFDTNVLARAMFVHDPFGVSDWLSRLANAATMCFFREPIARLLSNWQMICRWTEDEIAKTPNGHLISALALEGPEAFFSSPHPAVRRINWNGMVSHLLCDPQAWDNAWQDGSVDSAAFGRFALARAEETVRKLSFIGMQEDFQLSIAMLQAWLAIAPESPQAFNIASPSHQHIVANAAASIPPDLVELDLKLFNLASALYERQVQEYCTRYGDDLAAAAQERYRSTLTEPPAWLVVDMADAAPGAGWHAQEVNQSKHSRWIGPQPKATLNLRIKKDNDLLLRFRVTNILTARQFEQLRILVDGQDLQLHTWQESEFVLVVDAIAESARLNLKSDILEICIDCAEAICLANGDKRILGLEFCEIEVGAREAFILGAFGTPVHAR